MKSNKLKISIDNPCSQKWDNMTDKGMGKHCQACATTVIDYSVMSDRQIIEYLQHNKGSSCGRFRNDQLSRVIADTPIKQPVYLFKTFISLVLIGCGLKTENNTALQPSNQTELVNSIDQNKRPNLLKDTQRKFLKGTLFDENGNTKKFAQIHLQSDSNSYLTDAHGQFEIPIPNEMYGKYLTLEIKQNDSTTFQKAVSSSDLDKALTIHLKSIKEENSLNQSHFLIGDYITTTGFTNISSIETPWWQNIFIKKIKLPKIK